MYHQFPHCKDFYAGLSAVASRAAEGRGEAVPADDLDRVAGVMAPLVRDELGRRCAGTFAMDGTFIPRPATCRAIHAEAEDALRAIRRDEEGIDVDLWAKKRTVAISLIALAVSVLSLAVSAVSLL